MIERCMERQWAGVKDGYSGSIDNSWFVAEIRRAEIIGAPEEVHLWWLENFPIRVGNQAVLMKVCFE